MNVYLKTLICLSPNVSEHDITGSCNKTIIYLMGAFSRVFLRAMNSKHTVKN